MSRGAIMVDIRPTEDLLTAGALGAYHSEAGRSSIPDQRFAPSQSNWNLNVPAAVGQWITVGLTTWKVREARRTREAVGGMREREGRVGIELIDICRGARRWLRVANIGIFELGCLSHNSIHKARQRTISCAFFPP